EKGALSEAALARELVVGAATDGDPRVEGVAKESAGWVWAVESWSHAGAAFTGVALRLQAGEIVGLVGVEGSGARELARSLAGLEKASGRIRFSGETGP